MGAATHSESMVRAEPASAERSPAKSLAEVVKAQAFAFARLDSSRAQSDLFGPARPSSDMTTLVYPVQERQATPSELEKIPSKFIKIGGKNHLPAEMYEPLNAKIPEIIAWLDHHHPGAAFMFDGDNNEVDATFSQLISALVGAGRYVLCVKDFADNRPLSQAFVHGWKHVTSERTALYFLRLRNNTK